MARSSSSKQSPGPESDFQVYAGRASYVLAVWKCYGFWHHTAHEIGRCLKKISRSLSCVFQMLAGKSNL